jgi:hypothetical protein
MRVTLRDGIGARPDHANGRLNERPALGAVSSTDNGKDGRVADARAVVAVSGPSAFGMLGGKADADFSIGSTASDPYAARRVQQAPQPRRSVLRLRNVRFGEDQRKP